jgi:SynChlorMet cassette protein ScmC
LQAAEYYFTLANGFTVEFGATARAADLLAEFAAIYQLETSGRAADYRIVIAYSDERRDIEQTGASDKTSYEFIYDLPLKRTREELQQLHYMQLQKIGHHALRAIVWKTWALPVHCALAEQNGGGCIFAGHSGVGKSTLCSKMQTPWRAVSDDNALIVKNGNEYFLHPLPTWSRFMYDEGGYAVATAEHLPLSGIYFLTQADCDECRPVETTEAILRLRKSAEEASFIWQVPKDERISLNALFFDRACEIIWQKPHGELFSTVDGLPWLEIKI